MGFVEITLAADVCMPFIMVNDGKLKFCLSSSECSREYHSLTVRILFLL